MQNKHSKKYAQIIMLQGALTIHNIATNHLASSVKVETPTLHEQLLLQKEIKDSLGP